MSSVLDPVEFEYHHGRGEHVPVRAETDSNRRRPKYYSLSCFFQHCVDVLCFLLVLGFLVFAFWLCYYLYNNYGNE